MQKCGCKICVPKTQGRTIGLCALAFDLGMITALLFSSGTASVLIAVSIGCIGIALLK